MLGHSQNVAKLWEIEKQASLESIEIAKNEDLTFLAEQRERIMRMGHQEALEALVKAHKIDSKIKIINSIADNGLFAITK